MSFPSRNIHKNPRSKCARVPQAMTQFVLKVEKLFHIMGTTPIVELARAYGLHPRLWPLVLLTYSGDKLVGLQVCFVVDEGRTCIRRGGRILAELRGQGLLLQLREFARKYVREHYPNLQRERFTTTRSLDQTKLLEYDILSYHVEKKFPAGGKISKTKTVEIQICSREHFSRVIPSDPVGTQLFPGNIIVVNWCPFEPIRSNIDHMLQESDGVFVEKCPDHISPKSLSFGTFSPCVKFAEWLAAVYTKDPVLFGAHILHQLKLASETINGDFIFISFHDKDSTPLARRVMEEQLQLKEHDWLSKRTLKLYEKDASKY